MQLSAEDRQGLEKILADFEQFRKRKYRSFKWFTRIRKPFKIVYFLAVPAAFLASFLPVLLPFFLPLLLVGLGLFILESLLYAYVFRRPDEKFEERFKKEIMPLAFQKINPEFMYYPNQCFTDEQVKGMSLFKNVISRYYGEDYVRGKVKGVDIEFCEARLYSSHYSAGSIARGVLVNLFDNSDGMGIDDSNEFSKEVCFFKGLLLEVDFHKSFNGQVFALPKHYIDNGLFKRSTFMGRPRTETGHTDFDARYSVFTTNDVLLHYVLTPALLDKLLNLKNRLRADVFLSLSNGKLNMGINWGRDLFECDFKKGIPSIDDFLSLAKEVELFEYIITSLSQDRRIWGNKALNS